MFLSPSQGDLRTMHCVLDIFEGASGLACNFQKCQIMPIRCSDEDIVRVTQLWPGMITEFPVKYLGIPLAVSALPKHALQPLVDRVADRLPTWKGQLMNRSGRLALIKSTLTAIPAHILICIKLPLWVFKALEKILKAFLWSGTEVVNGGRCLVAWTSVQRPLKLGGLGVLDLKLFGQALRLRWLWLRRTELSHPWAMLCSDCDRDLVAFFQASLAVRLGDGRRALFWTDPWLEGRSIEQLAPNLAQAVTTRVTRSRTVADALSNRRWMRDITGPLTIPVLMEYVRIRVLTDRIVLHADEPDAFGWRWSPSGTFSSSSAYNAFFHGQTTLLGAKQLWRSRAPNECRFFLWLLLHGRVWTADRLQRHGMQNHGTCALCLQEVETLDHLFLQCPFSRKVWFKVLRRCGWQGYAPRSDDCLIVWWLQVHRRVVQWRRKCFDSIFILVVWKLWLERNARVFRQRSSQVSAVIHQFWSDVEVWCLARLVDRSQLVTG